MKKKSNNKRVKYQYIHESVVDNINTLLNNDAMRYNLNNTVNTGDNINILLYQYICNLLSVINKMEQNNNELVEEIKEIEEIEEIREIKEKKEIKEIEEKKEIKKIKIKKIEEINKEEPIIGKEKKKKKKKKKENIENTISTEDTENIKDIPHINTNDIKHMLKSKDRRKKLFIHIIEILRFIFDEKQNSIKIYDEITKKSNSLSETIIKLNDIIGTIK